MRFIFFFCCAIAFQQGISQEKKEIIQLDSIQIKLERRLDSLLAKHTKELNIRVLKKALKKLNPKVEKKPIEGWMGKGRFSFQLNQSAFNFDWQGGGTSNVAGNISLNYDYNFKKNSFTWDNRILGDYGVTFLKDEEFSRKTNDRIELNTRIGQQIGKSFWNYSLFINFRSQFDKGFRFGKDPDTEETTRTEETRFFSPAFIQIGPGILWKKSDNFNINLAPVTSRLIFVDDQFTTIEGYEDGDYFGVDAGESRRFEFGGSFAGYLKLDLIKNISVEQLLNLYSNYIEEPFNIDMDYTLNIDLKVNKYISGSFVFQSIYDDNATSAFQIREVLGLGLKYDF
ncbi:DUF3078 domain-containing protein [Aquimarina sp. ERC-38]|uniref:DUF3078 domain-containing protein n=1 Tax=Aquimarina sp. ERC-38 TaxID=2949996 RepID=UPI0022457F44|nr:DUF3078 domain-containing protein [Aquimarina sp. ERC-38]UZO81809.1 DUF3078 domain-containing protein [Aquimarina sp. ERC-38]